MNAFQNHAIKCNDLLVGENQVPKMIAWFDVECYKEAVNHPSWPQKTRTVPFMAGIMLRNSQGLWMLVVHGEERVIDTLQRLADSGYDLRYSATHDYDEMVVTGRWLYVRRAPLERPGPWPHVEDATFVNIRKVARQLDWKRGEDIASKDIPALWDHPDYDRAIALHNFRDVLLLVASDPDVVLSEDSQEMFQAAIK